MTLTLTNGCARGVTQDIADIIKALLSNCFSRHNRKRLRHVDNWREGFGAGEFFVRQIKPVDINRIEAAFVGGCVIGMGQRKA